MKKIINATILATALLLVFVTPAVAYDPPGQGSDNATDVILWMGDNVTIEWGDNVTLEWSDNLTIETETVTIDVEGLTDSNESIATDYLAFFIVAFLLVIIFKYKGPVLYAFGVPVSFVYGFTTAGEQEVYSPLWVAALFIGLLSFYFLYEIAKGPIEKAIRGNKQ